MRMEILEAARGDVEALKKDLVEALKRATPVDTGEARDGWKVTPSGVENRVEHISRLNSGSSQQAPKFFIEQTLLADPRVRGSNVVTDK